MSAIKTARVRVAYFSLAIKHGIYRDRTDGHRGRSEISSWIAAWAIRSPAQGRPRRRTCLSPGRFSDIEEEERALVVTSAQDPSQKGA